MKTCYVLPEVRAIADLVQLPDGPWLLTRINVPSKNRRRGHGSRLLHMILADADREGATLVLEVSPSGGLTGLQLEQWYTRNGFGPVAGTIMVRKPVVRR